MDKQTATTIFVGIFMAMAGILIGQATDSDVKSEMVIIRREIAIYHRDVNGMNTRIAVQTETLENAIERQDGRIALLESVCREEDVHGHQNSKATAWIPR